MMSGPDKRTGDNVKVYVRQRPFRAQSKKHNIIQKMRQGEIQVKSGYNERNFNFDNVFNGEASQLDVYNVAVSPMIGYMIAGYNCTIIAYGQTGAGKTHTVFGDNPNNRVPLWSDKLQVGMMPMASTQLFSELAKLSIKIQYAVRISFVEIYNEEIHDLLNENVPSLRICDDPGNKGSVYLKELTEVTVNSAKDVFSWLTMGLANREQKVNVQASHAHIIFTLLINTRETSATGGELIKTGKLHFVDMAGSEQMGRPGFGDVRARDTDTTNKSLLTFRQVITALAQKDQHVPYKYSKLTRILQESLGGNTKTCMIATIFPNAQSWDETINTLECAQMARTVVNNAHVNINKNQVSFVKDIQDEINRLKQDLEIARTGNGFHMTEGGYETMKQTIESSSAQELELIQQINALNHFKLTKELDNQNLNEAFTRAATALRKVTEELNQITAKVEQDERVLTYATEKDAEMTETANVLLNVCEATVKHQDIYLKKYEEQCAATLTNADTAKQATKTSVGCFDEIHRVTDTRVNDHLADINKARVCAEALNTNIKDVRKIVDVASVMRAKTGKLDVNVAHLFKRGTKTFNKKSVEDRINQIYDNQMQRLKDQSNYMQNQLITLKSRINDRQFRQEAKFLDFFKESDNGIAQTSECSKSTREILNAILKNMAERIEYARKQKMRNQKLRTYITEGLLTISREQSATLIELKNINQGVTDLHKIIRKLEDKLTIEDVKTLLKDIQQLVRESGKSKMSVVLNARLARNENANILETQMEFDKAEIHQRFAQRTAHIGRHFENYNGKMKDDIQTWLNNTNLITKNSFQTSLQSSAALERTLNVFSDSRDNYLSKIKKIIEELMRDLKEMEQDVANAHVGDTPVKCTYDYPKTIKQPVSRSEFREQLTKIVED